MIRQALTLKLTSSSFGLHNKTGEMSLRDTMEMSEKTLLRERMGTSICVGDGAFFTDFMCAEN